MNTRPDRKQRRQIEAKERQARWDALNDFEKAARKRSMGYRYDPAAGVK